MQIAFSIIEEELGQPLEMVFSKISSQTIAAASLGQVYHATLRDSGEDVAIKVVECCLGRNFFPFYNFFLNFNFYTLLFL